jgi:integrase
VTPIRTPTRCGPLHLQGLEKLLGQNKGAVQSVPELSKTVQKFLGHRDIASTMRYLAKAESKKVREKVNAVWA